MPRNAMGKVGRTLALSVLCLRASERIVHLVYVSLLRVLIIVEGGEASTQRGRLVCPVNLTLEPNGTRGLDFSQ